MQQSFHTSYGPWALVTGASSGIGAEFARQLAAMGLNVVLVARRAQRLDALACELREAAQVEVLSVPLDLLSPGALAHLSDAVGERSIGLLINNAGSASVGSFVDCDIEQELRLLDLNTRVPLALARTFAPGMVERKTGGIVFLASLIAFRGTPYSGNYAASKAWNLVMAESIGPELQEHGVDVLALCPGFTDTEMLDVVRPGLADIPALRTMQPDAVVRDALRSLGRRRAVIPGVWNRILHRFTELLGREGGARFSGGITRRLVPRD